MTKHTKSIAAIAATSLLAAGVQAGVVEPSKPIKEVVTESAISGDIGVDVTNQYYFRGILQNSGPVRATRNTAIIQPYADLSFRVFEGGGFLNSLSVDLGVWNSFRPKGGGNSTNNWSEVDFSAGLSATLAEKWSVGAKYIVYASPNSSFATAGEVGLSIGYDDSDLLGDFALNPHVGVNYEVSRNTGLGTSNGIYYEIGVEPGHTYGDLTLSVPLTVGFGGSGYYGPGGNGYGFFTGGLKASYALSFIPQSLGAWSLSASAMYLNAGAPAAANAVLGASKDQVIFTGGLRVEF